MLEFYKQTFLGLLAMVLLSSALAIVCLNKTFSHLPLLPAEQSSLNWTAKSETDQSQGGSSYTLINDTHYSLDFELNVQPGPEHPGTSLAMYMQDKQGQLKLADLSDYEYLSFSVKCAPANVLTAIVFTFDPKLSQVNNYLTYPAPSSYFSCEQNWTKVNIDLKHLEFSEWWLEMFDQKLSLKQYNLGKVAKIQFGTTRQSPINRNAKVQIAQLELHGKNWNYLYSLIAILSLLWLAFGFYFFKQYSRQLTHSLKHKILQERPVVAYRQLELTSQNDKEKDKLFNFLATNYANSELSLELVAKQTGINRSKLNELLKQETGLTFTAHLNKLRLTEAARLLSEKGDANVAEIAFSVGYKNVSYFNKLFKAEYSCTPKSFKNYLK